MDAERRRKIKLGQMLVILNRNKAVTFIHLKVQQHNVCMYVCMYVCVYVGVYVCMYVLIITGVQASGVIIDRLLLQCCFVWSEIVGPHSSGNFND